MKSRHEGKMINDKSTDPGLSAAERKIQKEPFTKAGEIVNGIRSLTDSQRHEGSIRTAPLVAVPL
jgi:hypothetical protein